MKFTGEQFIPSTKLEEVGAEINYEHWHRYLYASSFTKNKVVLDIACGEGYGSCLLAGSSKRVVGVDVSPEAIAYANSKYVRRNLEFKQGSVTNIPISGKGIFDVVVSFETIEHVGEGEQKTFLKEVKRLLKPNGIFIVSTPNKLVYSDIPGYKNEFHIKEFYIGEFKSFLEKHFKNVNLQGQTVYPVSYLWNPDEGREKLVEYRLQHSPTGFQPTGEQKAMSYVVAWCSNEKITPKPASLLVDLSNKAFTARDQYIRDLGGQIEIRERSLQSLSSQLAEREQSLSAQLAEREQGIQLLSARLVERERQLAEKERNIQALSAQLADIYRSIGWRIIGFIRWIREILAPVGSTRGRLLRMFLNGLRLWRAEGFNSVLKRGFRKLNPPGEKTQDISFQALRDDIALPISRDPIIVYQPGKVGSRTVVSSLVSAYKTLGIEVPVHHEHYLNGFEKFKQKALEELPNPKSTLAAIEQGESLRKEIDENEALSWKVITLIRDPIARIISALFQNLLAYYPDWRERYLNGQFDFDELQKLIINIITINLEPDDWFDTQIKSIPAFGIDVYAEPFPFEKGYKTYLGAGRASLLLIRLENLNDCAGQAMREFLGLENFVLQNENTSEEKDYIDLYRAFKEKPWPMDFVRKVYDTKFARHFYSESELKAFTKRWTQKEGIDLMPSASDSDMWQTPGLKPAPTASKVERIIQISKTGWTILRTQGIRSAWHLVARRLRPRSLRQAPIAYPIRPPRKAELQQAWLPVLSVDAPLVIPSSITPLVSIVVVVTNVENARYCLTALAGHSSRYEFDVIVVDDGSHDETNKFLASVSGIQLVRNETRKGFAAGCNLGTSLSQGQFLLFLRDNTVLQPECVNELIGTILANENCGLAGAKLIESSGLLLEAGGTFRISHLPEYMGIGGDAISPSNNYLRPVDFSSSVIAISRKSLNEAGGFDEQFNSYSEADLGATLKSLGYENYYQPLACAVLSAHAQATENEDNLFVGKWSSAILKKSALSKVKKVLFIDTLTPTPDKDSGSVDAVSHMSILHSMGFHVTFIPAGDLSHAGKYTNDLQRLGIECIYPPHYHTAVEYITQLGRQYELVIVCRVNNAAYLMDWLRKYCPRAKVIFNTVDLHYLREMRQAEIEKSEEKMLQARKIRESELETMKRADYTLVISQMEKELLDAELPDTPIIRYPLIMSISDRKEIPFEERKDIMFIGGFQHKPNLDAVLYFVADIWSIIQKRIPDMKFHIIGSEPPREILDLAGDSIIVAGHIENLSEYFNHCKLSIAPLRYGAGLKGKVGRSLGYGVPVVATDIAVEGSALVDGQDILVANDPQSFAETVVKAYEDEALWKTLSQNGMAFFDKNYSLESGKNFFSNLMDTLNRRQVSPAKIPLQLGMANSLDEYKTYLNEMTAEYPRRLEIEKKMVGSRNGFFTPGHCFVCNQDVEFYSDFSYAFTDADGNQTPNWRERMVCPSCELNNRMRAAIQIFEQVCEPNLDDDIYLTEQKTPLYDWFQKNYSVVTGSEYLGDKIPYGNFDENGIRNETLTGLTFHDNAFDCILSFDVFEHIPDYVSAFQETLRCLKPGERLIFTDRKSVV